MQRPGPPHNRRRPRRRDPLLKRSRLKVAAQGHHVKNPRGRGLCAKAGRAWRACQTRVLQAIPRGWPAALQESLRWGAVSPGG